ncbi:Endonuclease/Exonuclease/phosphatase family protein [Planctomycetes bacterium Pan216]|uniref:Endonuclease/Exonuclease/phosphatase family protein n=1 Tax=Kolteria novifilia TaxID=2527975 RepID=A0A518AYR9_9BACT|nr:Endonuclease/Exonuclease/phosphatase family protein [Planctomycetes bacterium Pan216]
MTKRWHFWILGLVVLLGCEAGTAPPGLLPKSISALQSQPTAPVTEGAVDSITVCSFNIQFLGSSRSRDDAALVDVVDDYDVVVVQELVAPPYSGTFPDGSAYRPDKEAGHFFNAMRGAGFEYVLSSEDTGTGAKNHQNGSTTEWWVAFYKPTKVKPAADLPNGFLANDRTDHTDYERVPYAFGFRTIDGNSDFVLISVHLQPNNGPKARARRKQELTAIAQWIDANDAVERDFIILGDMNIENAKELASATPYGFVSLNDECRPTNTNQNNPRPYDHVMINSAYSVEVDTKFDMQVIDLVKEVRPHWKKSTPFPGDPYNHNEFRKYFSDHHPVVFRMNIPSFDDDLEPVTRAAAATEPATK